MNKKMTVGLYLFFFIFIIPTLFYVINTSSSIPLYSQTVNFSGGKVIYDLPYPGILPDNPLYLVKMVRDRLLDWATRDNIKKAQLYLLYTDKRAASAILLSKKGKNSSAISTLTKGEKYFLKIPDLIILAKKQGVTIPESLFHRIKLSNDKHKEIIEDIAKQSPQGEEKQFENLLQLNQKIKEALGKI